MIPHSRARREEDLGQLRRAGLGQRAVELEEARRSVSAPRRAPARPPRPLAVAPLGGPSRAWLGSFLCFVCRVVSRVCGVVFPKVATESCPATLNEQDFASRWLYYTSTQRMSPPCLNIRFTRAPDDWLSSFTQKAMVAGAPGAPRQEASREASRGPRILLRGHTAVFPTRDP